MQEKLSSVIDRAQFAPSILTSYRLEVRDITSDPKWLAAYEMEIPVLTALSPWSGNEVALPRPAPRITADRLQRHVEAALGQLEEGGN
ncbi:MAG: hypothetical protein WDW38_005860 [Sanguina aurantia]